MRPLAAAALLALSLALEACATDGASVMSTPSPATSVPSTSPTDNPALVTPAPRQDPVSPAPPDEDEPPATVDSGGPVRYRVTIRFNETVTDADIRGIGGVLSAYDPDLDFLIMESFPPAGSATLTSADPSFCEAVKARIEGETYVAGVSCATASNEPPGDDGDTPVSSGPSGIEGQTLVGPACPVVTLDNPCPDRPIQATVEVWDRDGKRLVTTFTSDAEGRFRVELAPGTYQLRPLPPNPASPLPSASTHYATVFAGRFSIVMVSYDSGIR